AFAPQGPAEKPKFEEPGSVPEEVRKFVSDAEIIPIYCAMTKWRSGQFFIAMDALKKHLVPALAKVKNILDIEIHTPDIDSLAAEAQKKIEGICNVKTVDEADRLTRDFMAWGKQLESGQFGSLGKDLSTKMRAKGNEFRQKIEAEINPIIEADKTKIEQEIKDSVNTYVSSIKFDHEPSAGELAAARNQIEQFVNSKVAAKKAEIQQKVQAKVEEMKTKVMGPFLEAAESLKGIGPKIDAEIKANASRYDQYRQEAFRLRKTVVFNVLEKILEVGLKELDAAASVLEEAKKEDPSLKSAGEIKAELAQDRKALESKLDVALESGDEAAFQAALNDFRAKWENIRVESEKAASQGIDKACTVAAAQFQQARAQIDSQLPKIVNLQLSCANSVSDECLKISEFSSRFDTITKKLTDLKAGMAAADKICLSKETADRKNLIALFRKIKADAEDAKIFGLSLEAEKSKAIADSFQKICAQVLPQLRAGKTELEKSEFAALKKILDECRGKSDERCKMVNQLTLSFNALDKRLASFNNNLTKVETVCQKGGDETQLEQLRTILNVLKREGEEIKVAAKNLQAEAADKV
ncbi:MAG: hypothetical protein Q8L57_02020, partial [bacterium]|nr:hypothetical protein [bacterium]